MRRREFIQNMQHQHQHHQKNLQYWIKAIVVVAFDVSDGHVVEAVFLPSSQQQLKEQQLQQINKEGEKSNDDHDNNNKHSNSDDGDGNNAKKDKTPFVLAQPMPFP